MRIDLENAIDFTVIKCIIGSPRFGFEGSLSYMLIINIKKLLNP